MSSSDVSAVVNYFPTINEGFTTSLGVGGVLSGGTAVPLTSTSGLTNGSIFVGIIEPGETKQQVFTGTVDVGGSQITGVKWTRGTNVDHLAGATIVDYVTGTVLNMIIKGILTVLNQTGGLKSGLTIPTPTLTSPTMQGTVDGWIGANESWTYASSTTITVPSDARNKYEIGDLVKLTQSATIKYFAITGVTATVLTVAGLNGVTVANSAITLPAYSKSRSPAGAPQYTGGQLPYNRYKFHAYLSASIAAVVTAITPFNTTLYDTNSNFDTVTHQGRYTAPLAGFYFFSACLNWSGAPQNLGYNCVFFKNGTQYLNGNTGVNMYASGGSIAMSNSAVIQLAAGDYIEVASSYGSAGTLVGGQTGAYFQGHLMSIL